MTHQLASNSNTLELILSEIKKVSGLTEALRMEIKTEEGAANGDTQAMMQSAICRDILSIFGGWLWETDEAHRFRYISPQFRQVVGSYHEAFMNHSRIEIEQKFQSSAGQASIISKKHMEILKNEREFRDHVYSVELPTAETKWFKVSGFPRRDPNNSKFLGYWGIGQDVTDQMEKELAERRRLEEFGSGLDALDVSILILDAKNLISYRNQRWLKLHDRIESRFTTIGASYRDYLWASIQADLFPESSGNEEDFVAARMEQNAHPPHETFRMQRQNGIVLSIKVTKISQGGTLIVSNDITNWSQ